MKTIEKREFVKIVKNVVQYCDEYVKLYDSGSVGFNDTTKMAIYHVKISVHCLLYTIWKNGRRVDILYGKIGKALEHKDHKDYEELYMLCKKGLQYCNEFLLNRKRLRLDEKIEIFMDESLPCFFDIFSLCHMLGFHDV